MKWMAVALLIGFAVSQAHSQSKPVDDGGLYANVFVAGGNAEQLGFSLGEFNTTLIKHFFTSGAFVELALVLPNGKEGTSGIFSFNHLSAYRLPRTERLLPFATVGYSRLFGLANAANYGTGLIYRYHIEASCCASELRFEARDYYAPGQDHRVVFRISWGGAIWGED